MLSVDVTERLDKVRNTILDRKFNEANELIEDFFDEWLESELALTKEQEEKISLYVKICACNLEVQV